MVNILRAFSSYSVNDQAAAKEFYASKLGLDVQEDAVGLNLNLPDGGSVFIYQKENHVPAEFTVLNLVVQSIDAAIDECVSNGLIFERYTDLPAPQDEKGVLRGLAAKMGPDIAWFKDPAGNVVSLIQES
jgi:catechol 2,3-dioxygenase-like lactoylglutathione lyase family enzyme